MYIGICARASENLFRLIGSFGYWLLWFGVCGEESNRTNIDEDGARGREEEREGEWGREGRHSLGLASASVVDRIINNECNSVDQLWFGDFCVDWGHAACLHERRRTLRTYLSPAHTD